MGKLKRIRQPHSSGSLDNYLSISDKKGPVDLPRSRVDSLFFKNLFIHFIFIFFYILYLHMYLYYTYFLHDAYTTLTCTSYNTYVTIQLH